jgi:hypothetical protein
LSIAIDALNALARHVAVGHDGAPEAQAVWISALVSYGRFFGRGVRGSYRVPASRIRAIARLIGRADLPAGQRTVAVCDLDQFGSGSPQKKSTTRTEREATRRRSWSVAGITKLARMGFEVARLHETPPFTHARE